MRRARETGFSLLEVLIATTLLVALVGLSLSMVRAGADLAGSSARAGQREGRAQAALADLARELREAASVSAPAPGRLEAVPVTGLAGQRLVTGPPVAWTARADGALVRSQDSAERVVLSGLAPGGLTAARSGGRWTVTLTLVWRDEDGRTHTRRVEQSAWARNQQPR